MKEVLAHNGHILTFNGSVLYGGAAPNPDPIAGIMQTFSQANIDSSIATSSQDWQGVALKYDMVPTAAADLGTACLLAFNVPVDSAAGAVNYRMGLFEQTSSTAASCIAISQRKSTIGGRRGDCAIILSSYNNANIIIDPSKVYWAVVTLSQNSSGSITFGSRSLSGLDTSAMHVVYPTGLSADSADADWAYIESGNWYSDKALWLSVAPIGTGIEYLP